MPKIPDEQWKSLHHVIDLARGIISVAADGRDGFATFEQVRQEILANLEKIKAELLSHW